MREPILEPGEKLMSDDIDSSENMAEESSAEEVLGEEEVVIDVEVAADDAADDAAENGVADAAWRDVLAQVDGLAEAAGRWTRAAVDDPQNRQRAKELRDHIEQMARSVGDTIDGAVSDATASDVGQSFKDAAGKTGVAFKTAGAAFANEVAPRMASAFRGAADQMNGAAAKMERPSPPPPPPGDTPGEAEATDATVNEESADASQDNSPE